MRGYLLNRMAPTAFVLSLRLIHAGEPVVPEECFDYFSPTALRRGGEDGAMAQHESELLGYPGLYPRHARILKLIMDGCSNKEIAREMGMTEDLVKLHVRHIMQTTTSATAPRPPSGPRRAASSRRWSISWNGRHRNPGRKRAGAGMAAPVSDWLQAGTTLLLRKVSNWSTGSGRLMR